MRTSIRNDSQRYTAMTVTAGPAVMPPARLPYLRLRLAKDCADGSDAAAPMQPLL